MNFIPNNIPPMMNNFNVQPMNPYQDRMDRYIALQQQQQQNQPQQIQSNISNTNMNFIVVENIQKAKEQVVPCGFTMWMRDSNEPYQYIKSVDAIGTPSFKVLKVEDVTEKVLSNNTQQVNSSEQYVQIEQYNKLCDTVKQLQNTVNYYSSFISNSITPKEVVDVEPKEVKKTTTKKVGEVNG